MKIAFSSSKILFYLMLTCIFFFQDSEPDIIDGLGAETGHVMATTVGGINGQPKQVQG